MESDPDPILSRTSENISLQSNIASGNSSVTTEDVENTKSNTYDHISSLFVYSKMFLTRLGKDLFSSIMNYFYSERVLPNHILDLINTQKRLRLEREINTSTYTRCSVIQHGTHTSVFRNDEAMQSF